MKKLTLIIALTLLATSTLLAGGLSTFEGTWLNTDKNTRGITKLKITQTSRVTRVQAWGKAHPADTDMGSRIGRAYSSSVGQQTANDTRALVVNYHTSFSQRMIIVDAPHRNRLRAREFVYFTDRSNRSPYTNYYSFTQQTAIKPSTKPGWMVNTNIENQNIAKPIPTYTPTHQIKPTYPVKPTYKPVHPVKPGYTIKPMPGIATYINEDKISFNHHNTYVKKVGNNWKLIEGKSHWLMDFGRSEAEARKALKTIKHYGLNEMCYVGRPNPSMTYFLSRGKSPVGRMSGEDAIRFNPNNISVRKVGSRWKIMEGQSHMMMDFENSQAEANLALKIIKRYGFTHQCFIGRPNASMTYFRK